MPLKRHGSPKDVLQKMRATWITSISAGIVLGVASAFFRGSKHPAAGVGLLCLLAVCIFFGAIGFAQMQEARAEKKAFGPATIMRHERHGRLPIPGVGRMLLLVTSSVLTESLAIHFLR